VPQRNPAIGLENRVLWTRHNSPVDQLDGFAKLFSLIGDDAEQMQRIRVTRMCS